MHMQFRSISSRRLLHHSELSRAVQVSSHSAVHPFSTLSIYTTARSLKAFNSLAVPILNCPPQIQASRMSTSLSNAGPGSASQEVSHTHGATDTNMDTDAGVTMQPIPASAAQDAPTVSALKDMINAAYAASEAGITKADVPRTTTSELRRRLAAGELYGAYTNMNTHSAASPTQQLQLQQAQNPTTTTSSSLRRIVGVARLHFMPDRALETVYGPGREYGVLNDLWDEAAPEGHAGIDHSAASPTHGVPRIATFSMLAVDRDFARKGIGAAIVRYLEYRARHTFGCRQMEIQLQDPIVPMGAFSDVLRKWYESLGYKHVRTLSMDEFLPGYEPTMEVPVVVAVMRKHLG